MPAAKRAVAIRANQRDVFHPARSERRSPASRRRTSSVRIVRGSRPEPTAQQVAALSGETKAPRARSIAGAAERHPARKWKRKCAAHIDTPSGTSARETRPKRERPPPAETAATSARKRSKAAAARGSVEKRTAPGAVMAAALRK